MLQISSSKDPSRMTLVAAYDFIGKAYTPGCVSWYEKQGRDNPWSRAQNALEQKMQEQINAKQDPYGPWVKDYAAECVRLCGIYSSLVTDPKIDGRDASMFGFMYADGNQRYLEIERTQAGQCVECESTDGVRLANKTGRVLIYCNQCVHL